MILGTEEYHLWKYVRYLRMMEYHHNTKHVLRYLYFQRKKNNQGNKVGISTWMNNFGQNVHFWHGTNFVNGEAKIGYNCQLHGMNCIGNKGDFDLDAPTIGNNVDIGVGAKIIGKIYIADDVKIGANAVVTKSCYDKGAVLVGVPARKIK